MQVCIIHEYPDWRVTSYGNGLGYAVDNLAAGLGLYFQGDDADTFCEQLEALTEGSPCLNYCDALSVIWNDYSDNAKPLEESAA